ncbi:hypothetical protein Bca4012_094030 [Brassica carinata]
MVLEKQPYTYRGWIVALDRWINKDSPMFLKQVPFKVRIDKLPNIYPRPGIVRNIGSKLGYVDEISIVEPTNNREAKVWLKILFDVDDVITLTRMVEIIKGQPPVELDFRYMGLQKFCTLCGSLRHEYEMCNEASQMQHRQYELMDISTNPYASVQQRSAALQEYITTREVGESSGTALQGQAEHTQTNAMEAQRSYQQGSGINPNQPTLLADPTASQQDHGVKRKTMEDTEGEASTSSKRLETEQSDHGLTVLLKPSQQP